MNNVAANVYELVNEITELRAALRGKEAELEALLAPKEPKPAPTPVVLVGTVLDGVTNIMAASPAMVFNAADLLRALKRHGRECSRNAVSNALSIMHAAGLVERVGHGEYMVKP